MKSKLLSILALAFIITGCGEDDDMNTPPDSTTSAGVGTAILTEPGTSFRETISINKGFKVVDSVEGLYGILLADDGLEVALNGRMTGNGKMVFFVLQPDDNTIEGSYIVDFNSNSLNQIYIGKDFDETHQEFNDGYSFTTGMINVTRNDQGIYTVTASGVDGFSTNYELELNYSGGLLTINELP